jgi:hypothetical protein
MVASSAGQPMPKPTAAALVGALIFSMSASPLFAQSSESDRLLPSKELAQLEVSHRQDGRVIDVAIKNNGSMVVTSVRLECVAAFTASTAPGSPKPQSVRYPKLIKKTFNGRLLPSGKTQIYMELEADRDEFEGCKIEEARGRPKKFYELL